MGDGTYSQYDNDGDTYFKAILIEEYFEKMKKYFTDKKKIEKYKILMENEINSRSDFRI